MKRPWASILFLFVWISSFSQEGFWSPDNIPDQLTKEMKPLGEGQGTRLPDSYSYPEALKAAVNLDDGNCSGVIISGNGLLLTNFHCVEPYLYSLDAEGIIDLDKGYFLNDNKVGPELTGLLVDIPVLSISTKDWDQARKEEWIKQKDNPIRRRIVKSYEPGKNGRGIITDVFDKISLVAVPPISLAKLGGNEDNWQWPRYSSDFVVLRVHRSDPLHQRDYPRFPHVKISKGISKNMSVMVTGYPSSTFRNSNSRRVQHLLFHDQSTRLKLRKKRLNIYSDYLEFNPDTRLPKDLMVNLENEKILQENEIRNVKGFDLVNKKSNQEEERIGSNKKLEAERNQLNLLYDSLEYYNLPRIYMNEGLTAPKIFLLVFGFSPLEDALSDPSNKDQMKSTLEAMNKKSDVYFDRNDMRLEKELFFKMLMQYYEDIPSALHNPNFKAIKHAFEGDVFRFVSELWDNSLFTDQVRLNSFIQNPDLGKLQADPMYTWVNDVISNYFISIAPKIKFYQGEIGKIESGMSASQSYTAYPEANGSLRISFGKVAGFQRNETDWSEPFCTVSGMRSIAKTRGLPREILKWVNSLEPGTMVSFLSEVEVSMGNSGSPILNSKGELIGLGFDQNIEGLGNRYYYDPKNQKCIGLSFEWIEMVVSNLGGMPDFFEKEFHQ